MEYFCIYEDVFRIMKMYVDASGCIWMYVDVFGCMWMYLDVCGCIWMSADIYGFPRIYSRCMQMYQDVFGCIQMYLAKVDVWCTVVQQRFTPRIKPWAGHRKWQELADQGYLSLFFTLSYGFYSSNCVLIIPLVFFKFDEMENGI